MSKTEKYTYTCILETLNSQFSSFEFAMTAEYKPWQRIFKGLASIWGKIFTNSSEKMTCLQLCVVFNFQICGTFHIYSSLRYLWIYFQVEAYPVQTRCQCFYSAVMANSKLDYFLQRDQAGNTPVDMRL